LSETAFLVATAPDTFDLRWFTPMAEVDLCGHATLASAHILFTVLQPDLHTVHFNTRSGTLHVRRQDGKIILDFPSRIPAVMAAPVELVIGLGKKPLEVLSADDYLAVYETEQEVLALQPDFKMLSRLELRGICITAPGEQVDFVSRFFAPKLGIPEDPVTGAAHTMLIPYWSNKLDKISLRARQVSKRGGELFCEDHGDRVAIGGQAVTFFSGTIEI
ncbi:PhzF family phenazine biosynthesis protein, partial [candidate division KSB1 bacterium]|nr:PhzF family phenazine biosynthesis protein [candidate division KSB1 bacterium]